MSFNQENAADLGRDPSHS